MQTKTIGVVIPIYNVEKYLKECLDSVINQTYTNLEIILVNDGSTDENSLNIAKEYTLKDKRITLFDKKNGGQSTARNVGIEYFSGEYKLKNKTQTIKENSLIEFNIEGNNPYEIYTVYKSYKAFNNEQDLTSFTYPIIDYIIFLDSDDYWELNCIEECVPRMDGVDVVWFANKHLYDNVEIPKIKQLTLFENYDFDKECQISSEEWAARTLQMGRKSFWFTVMGMINFDFLKNIKLKHYDYVILEDNLFGILLFMQAKKIYVYPKQMYRNRVRPNSTMNHDKKVLSSNIPFFLHSVYYSFDKNPEYTKEYFRTASWVLLNNQMKLFLQNNHLTYYCCLLMREFVKYYFNLAKSIFQYKIDPLGVSSVCLGVSEYIKSLKMQTKTIGVVIPIYNVEKYLKECLDSVINQTYTNLEIILVNDGSTDENSLNIAKEYTLKDKRITLFDKKNGGQSTARNVGIEYFSGEYKLKNKTQTIKENSLIEFNIEGNNPYEIYTVYKSYKAFNNEQDLTSFTYPIIDYIIFLDSDDYWELNCIEECVPRMDGVDVVWFDYNKTYEAGYLDQVNDWTWFLGYNKNRYNGKISSLLWLERYKQMKHFAFVWQGMINFNFLKNINLKFIDGIFHQDVHFGFLLFAQSNYIFLIPKKLLTYRIRNGATTVRNFQNNFEDEIPFYIKDLLGYFDIKKAKEYYSIYSWIQIILKVISLCNTKNNKYFDLYCLFIENLSQQILKLQFDPEKDPMYLNNYIESIIFFKHLYRKSQDIASCSIQLNQTQSKLSFQTKYGTAKTRIQNQLSYKLGQAMIINSKSFLGYIRMPFVLSYIKDKHKQEQKIYQEKIKKDPSLKLPPLENYPDYKEALKLKNHLSYKLGQALIKANKTWYKGGYIKMWFEVGRVLYKKKIVKGRNLKKVTGGGSIQGEDLDEQYFIKRHESFFHYKPDFRKPKTFNEKIIHRILFDRRDIYTFLADKIKVRLYIQYILEHGVSNNNIFEVLSKNIDELSSELQNTNKCVYLPKIYGIYKHTKDIDFNQLPDSFVIKTNHDWGGVVVVDNKAKFLADINKKIECLAKLQKHLDRNYYDISKEWHYKNIIPRVFIEENLNQNNNDLKDYRFHVFCHKTKFIQVANSSHTCNNLYYPNWKVFPIVYLNKRDPREIKKPDKLKKMLKLATLLSTDFDYIRVDMYYIDTKIYIGELTFTPNCGKAKIEPSEWDLKLGKMWKSDVFKL